MSSWFWEQHWWLVFAAAALIIPVGGMIASTFTTWMYFRQRREALAALKAYADSGRDPPPELVEVLKAQATGPGYGAFGPGGAGLGGPSAWADPASPWADPMRVMRCAWPVGATARPIAGGPGWCGWPP
jgi:hypothetical protein